MNRLCKKHSPRLLLRWTSARPIRLRQDVLPYFHRCSRVPTHQPRRAVPLCCRHCRFAPAPHLHPVARWYSHPLPPAPTLRQWQAVGSFYHLYPPVSTTRALRAAQRYCRPYQAVRRPPPPQVAALCFLSFPPAPPIPLSQVAARFFRRFQFAPAPRPQWVVQPCCPRCFSAPTIQSPWVAAWYFRHC